MEPEYAPLYTPAERLRHLLVLLPVGAAGYALCQWWFFPRLHAFSEHAVCETVLGVPGPSILFYGVFVLMPLSLAIALAAVVLPTAVRSIKSRRYPPLGKKVYRPTKIRTGRRAVALSLAPLIPILLMAGIAVWGYGQAGQILQRANAAHPNGWQECSGNVGGARAQSNPAHG